MIVNNKSKVAIMVVYNSSVTDLYCTLNNNAQSQGT